MACAALRRRANIWQSIFVFTLSVKPKNKYFAICSRKLLRYWPALRASLCQTGRLLNITLGINRSAFTCNRRDLWVFGSPTTMSIACSGQNVFVPAATSPNPYPRSGQQVLAPAREKLEFSPNVRDRSVTSNPYTPHLGQPQSKHHQVAKYLYFALMQRRTTRHHS